MPTAVGPSPHHKALLLCVSDYKHYPSLIGPRKDVFEIRKVLVAPIVGLFDAQNVRQLVNVDHDRAFEAICDFLDGSKRTDHLLLYFSGHGALDESDRLHFCFVNTRPKRWATTGVRWAEISERIEAARAASVTTILDCCYSGQSKGLLAAPLGILKAHGRCKLASCLETERSKDARQPGEPSPFTELVVRAFENPGPRSIDKGYISPSDIAAFVEDNRGPNLPHTPISETRGVGEIALAFAPPSAVSGVKASPRAWWQHPGWRIAAATLGVLAVSLLIARLENVTSRATPYGDDNRGEDSADTLQPGWNELTSRGSDPALRYRRAATPADLPPSPPPRGVFRVHMIDVGSGLSILIEGNDFTLLYDAGSIDTGETARRVLDYLLALNHEAAEGKCGTAGARSKFRLDHVVLSHPHADHVGYLDDVLGCFDVKNVWDSGRFLPSHLYFAFLEAISNAHDIRYHTVAAIPGDRTLRGRDQSVTMGQQVDWTRFGEGQRVALGKDAWMTFLRADATEFSNVNNNSLVIMLELGEARVLLTGDAGSVADHNSPSPEAYLLAQHATQLKADVLQVGHHGSSQASSKEFLEQVSPRIALISGGPKLFGDKVVTSPDVKLSVSMLLDDSATVLMTNKHDDRPCDSKIHFGPAEGPGGCDNWIVEIRPGTARSRENPAAENAQATTKMESWNAFRADGSIAIQEHQVTRREYAEFLGMPGTVAGARPYQDWSEISASSEEPVNWVSYEQAARFCETLGARLPSAEEWKRASKGRWGLDVTGTNKLGPLREWTLATGDRTVAEVCGGAASMTPSQRAAAAASPTFKNTERMFVGSTGPMDARSVSDATIGFRCVR
jgi:beta-lactamase superfamily II metal-dependent hydrolase